MHIFIIVLNQESKIEAVEIALTLVLTLNGPIPDKVKKLS